MSSRLKEKYKKEIIPRMVRDLGYKNVMAVPKLEKVVINSGTGQALKDDKYLDLVIATLTRITGQKPILNKAKKSVSAFKIRQGMTVGVSVTLRGDRMYDFIDKLVNIALARVRDFRGLDKKSIDKGGNLTIGFKENTVFPEIRPDEVERVHGLEITVVSTAKNKEEGYQLFSFLGFPFKKER